MNYNVHYINGCTFFAIFFGLGVSCLLGLWSGWMFVCLFVVRLNTIQITTYYAWLYIDFNIIIISVAHVALNKNENWMQVLSSVCGKRLVTYRWLPWPCNQESRFYVIDPDWPTSPEGDSKSVSLITEFIDSEVLDLVLLLALAWTNSFIFIFTSLMC